MKHVSIDGPDGCNFDPLLTIEQWQSVAKCSTHMEEELSAIT